MGLDWTEDERPASLFSHPLSFLFSFLRIQMREEKREKEDEERAMSFAASEIEQQQRPLESDQRTR